MARLVAVVPVMHVDDLDTAVDFYVSVLGFTESFRFGEPPYYAGVKLEPHDLDTHMHLNVTKEGVGQGEIYLSVDDVDAAYEAFKATVTPIVVDIRDQPYGNRDFSVRDPAGNFITIGAPGPED